MKTVLSAMGKGEEVFFRCPTSSAENIFSERDIDDAWDRLCRFASYVKTAFPETEKTGGIIDSPIVRIDETKTRLEEAEHIKIPGNLYVKRDDSLAVCGSLKARGGIYTVFKHAEDIAIQSGKLQETDDYKILHSESFRKLFSGYKISVGSTGNLGMSIGLSGARLGFDVTVYMSEEAKEWKKNMLRKSGVTVIEFAGDYTSALKTARTEAAKEENNFFVDDEDSADLFLGYAAAVRPLTRQLEEHKIRVDSTHPLLVYLPCGVGGGPGGITFGLKQQFGENVHCFFGEPTEMSCMALAMAEGKGDVSVYDIGRGNGTVADGLACSSPSVLAWRVMRGLLDGCFTVTDAHSLSLVKLLYESAGTLAEPSSCVALAGVGKVPYEIPHMENATHLVWLTGGSLVPAEEWRKIGLIL